MDVDVCQVVQGSLLDRFAVGVPVGVPDSSRFLCVAEPCVVHQPLGHLCYVVDVLGVRFPIYFPAFCGRLKRKEATAIGE